MIMIMIMIMMMMMMMMMDAPRHGIWPRTPSRESHPFQKPHWTEMQQCVGALQDSACQLGAATDLQENLEELMRRCPMQRSGH